MTTPIIYDHTHYRSSQQHIITNHTHCYQPHPHSLSLTSGWGAPGGYTWTPSFSLAIVIPVELSFLPPTKVILGALTLTPPPSRLTDVVMVGSGLPSFLNRFTVLRCLAPFTWAWKASLFEQNISHTSHLNGLEVVSSTPLVRSNCCTRFLWFLPIKWAW